MDIEEYDELRREVKDKFSILIENTNDRKCYKCVWFQHYPVMGAGAPERMPYARCEYFGLTWTCGQTAKIVDRRLECYLDNGKEVQ